MGQYKSKYNITDPELENKLRGIMMEISKLHNYDSNYQENYLNDTFEDLGTLRRLYYPKKPRDSQKELTFNMISNVQNLVEINMLQFQLTKELRKLNEKACLPIFTQVNGKELIPNQDELTDTFHRENLTILDRLHKIVGTLQSL